MQRSLYSGLAKIQHLTKPSDFYQGIWSVTGDLVEFDRNFRGHYFTDLECQQLLAGKTLTLKNLGPDDAKYSVRGRLERNPYGSVMVKSANKIETVVFKKTETFLHTTKDAYDVLTSEVPAELPKPKSMSQVVGGEELDAHNFQDDLSMQMDAMLSVPDVPLVEKTGEKRDGLDVYQAKMEAPETHLVYPVTGFEEDYEEDADDAMFDDPEMSVKEVDKTEPSPYAGQMWPLPGDVDHVSDEDEVYSEENISDEQPVDEGVRIKDEESVDKTQDVESVSDIHETYSESDVDDTENAVPVDPEEIPEIQEEPEPEKSYDLLRDSEGHSTAEEEGLIPDEVYDGSEYEILDDDEIPGPIKADVEINDDTLFA